MKLGQWLGNAKAQVGLASSCNANGYLLLVRPRHVGHVLTRRKKPCLGLWYRAYTMCLSDTRFLFFIYYFFLALFGFVFFVSLFFFKCVCELLNEELNCKNAYRPSDMLLICNIHFL